MYNIFQLILLSMIYNQDVFEGYTLFAPGAGGSGGSDATTYQKDN